MDTAMAMSTTMLTVTIKALPIQQYATKLNDFILKIYDGWKCIFNVNDYLVLEYLK